ncbi:CRISPR-associated exonuclease Cas4 [Flavobacterium sp. CF108]|uniref:AAA family ATPase n=1 Tax=unclassified Flavobacterium TaxID=196869 RepID=UPI0008D20FC5|nr:MULTISPECIES: AAA family ATPase [unclassified Flavobacterium]SEN89786.1 CRISPR-associated exonuclease Cas4 [Flavobacterium sp. fv08]SHH24610.1 CRISPR-associated exonuclease Cas4 [Flavobacterium sp. CF108]
MKINSIKISNWRSIISENIIFQDLMIFIGQNNHGKSNVLSSVLFFFGEIAHQSLDFNGDSEELWVEIEFTDLSESEGITFKKYVSADNRIKARKTALKNGSFTYNGYIEEANDDWLKESKISEFKKREIAENLPLAVFLPDKGAITIDHFRLAQNQYIQENIENITFNYILEETNFLGLKNVAKGSFGDLFFIPSIKNASDELNPKGSSLFGQLYSRVINKISEHNPQFREAKEKIIELTKILNKTNIDGEVNENRPEDLTSLENLLDKELISWNTKIDIQITAPNVDDIFRVGANVSVDDGIKTDIARKGHGLQRALIFALIKAWSKVLKEEREGEDQDPEVSTRKSSKSTYFIFEEPELFLHPQAQKELFFSLVNLSKDESQVILCTHSSSFLDLEFHKSICIVKKESIDTGTKVLQYVNDIFEDVDEKKKFNLSYWINPERSELFFAKKVILVEGQTDRTIIPMLAQSLNIFRYDFTVIDCGSKNNIPLYMNLLNKFKIEYCAVYDRDHQTGKNADGIATADLVSKSIEDALNNSFGKTHILENDIEEELGMTEKVSSGKAYKAISFIADENFIISDSFKQKVIEIYTE